jgi:hypothetical protein
MKKIISLLLCVCLILPVLAGCEMTVTLKEGFSAKRPTETPGGSGGNNNGGLGSLDGLAYWGDSEFADLFAPLGNATFTLDNSRTATGEFTPGRPLSLSVTDSAGAVWTLDVPADALTRGETITMTAMRDVSLGEYGALKGGVQLSPDGLEFRVPVMLTATGSGYGEDSIMLQGDHNGGNVEFVSYSTTENSATAFLWHFSSGFGGGGGPFDNLRTRGNRDANRMRHYVQEYDYYNPIAGDDVPEPPSMSFNTCPDHKNNDDEAKLEAYWKQFREPEWALMQRIIASASGSGVDWDAEARGDTPFASGKAKDYLYALNVLIERLDEKVTLLGSKYEFQEDKYKAVVYVDQCWTREYDAIYATVQTAWYKNWIQERDAWILRAPKRRLVRTYEWGCSVWNYWMEKLVEDHDYMAAHALQEVIKFNVSIGHGATDEYIKMLGNALTFKVEHEIDLQGEGVMFYKLSGLSSVSMDQAECTFGKSSGTGVYDSYSVAGGEAAIKGTPSYENTVQLSNLDPCDKKTKKAGFCQFGAQWETVYLPDVPGVEMPIPGPVYLAFGLYARSDMDMDTGLYSFDIPLTKGSAQMDETFFWAGEFVFALTVTMTHTPQGEFYIK